VPDDSAERCRVVLDSCKLNEKYNIMVAAVSKGNSTAASTDLLLSVCVFCFFDRDVKVSVVWNQF